MTQSIINVENLTKTYRAPDKPPGLGVSLRSLIRQAYQNVEAVQRVSFAIDAGEMVGLMTTIPAQALAGTLTPGMLGATLLFAAGALFGAGWLLRQGLRRYTSASS